MLGLRATGPCSVVGNPSRACLILPGALSIFLARYFTSPSRQDIDRAPTLTASSRILDGAGAGQAVRMLAKPCPAWLSALQPLVVSDKSVQSCPELFASSPSAQAAGDGQLSNALANEHQVVVERFQRAAHVVGNVRRSALLDPVGKLLHRGAQGELVLIEAVEQAGDQFGVRHGGSPCFEEA